MAPVQQVATQGQVQETTTFLKHVKNMDSVWPAGFDGFQSASTYKAPPRIDIWEYDTPADPRFAALTPSGFGVDRPLFNPDEPPYEVERESNLIEVVSHAQIRDPYYKFSRDPDMSLDTAPYPAGVPKPGMLAAADGDSALIAARVKTGQVQYISALVEEKEPLDGVLRREQEQVELRGSAIVRTTWLDSSAEERTLLAARGRELALQEPVAAPPIDAIEAPKTDVKLWVTRTKVKLEEANRLAEEAEEKAREANELAAEADRLADLARQLREKARQAQEAAKRLPSDVKGKVEEFRRQLASTRSEVNEKRLAAEGAQREIEYTVEVLDRKQQYAHKMRAEAAERRAEVEELERQLAKLAIAKKDAESAEKLAEEVQEETQEFLAQMQRKEEEAEAKAQQLAETKRHLQELVERLQAAIIEEELSGPHAMLLMQKAKTYLKEAEMDEAEAYSRVQRWRELKEAVEQLDDKEKRVRSEALTAKGEEEEVPIAEQLREPKLAEQMLELQPSEPPTPQPGDWAGIQQAGEGDGDQQGPAGTSGGGPTQAGTSGGQRIEAHALPETGQALQQAEQAAPLGALKTA